MKYNLVLRFKHFQNNNTMKFQTICWFRMKILFYINTFLDDPGINASSLFFFGIISLE